VVMLPYGKEQGFVIGAIYSDVEKPPENTRDKKVVVFEDGTRIEYDRENHKLYADVKGEIFIRATGNVSVVSDKNVLVKAKRIDFNP